MRRWIWIGIGIWGLNLQSLYLGAQIQDYFTDLNLTDNPEWYGDLSDFKVNEAEELQLNAMEAGESMIYTGFNLEEGENPKEIWWRADIRLTFSPSGNNYFRFYLWMNGSDPYSPDFQSYYLHIGETGSLDGVDLYYENSAGSIRIIDGLPGLCIASDNTHHLLVKWKAETGWSIQASENQSEWLIEQGNAYHAWDPTNGYLGIKCVYTSSNLNRFYIDNLYAGPAMVDTMPPGIVQRALMLPGVVRISFSEVMDSLTLKNQENYRIIQQSSDMEIHSFTINYQKNQPKNLELTIESEWQSDIAYELKVSGLRDTIGNLMTDTTLELFYHRPARFDVVFTEIMADPTPVIELPDAEFLEIYNRTSVSIELKNWRLIIGSSKKFLPEYELRSQEFLILTSTGRCRDFGPFVNCIEVLSSNQLTNSSGQIVLEDSSATFISFCEYDVTWHSSSFHADGGFSLEKVDPDNYCEGKANWISSPSANGGTPGFANQASDLKPDIFPPKLVRAYWIDTLSLGLVVSESLPDLHRSDQLLYLNDTIACYCEAMDPLFRLFTLWPVNPLDSQECYHISSALFVDCNDNQAIPYRPEICQPSLVAPGDILINEILFNPIDDDPDFVELINVSEKVLDLSQLVFATRDSLTQTLENIKTLSTLGYLLFPEEYLVLTAQSEKIKSRYPVHDANAFIQPEVSLPSLPNEAGNLALCDLGMQIIDYIEYHENQHFPLLNTFEGVSLEKINPNEIDFSANNWHSASEIIGWASPGIKNSQFNINPVPEQMFSLGSEYFTPNQDGNMDLLSINYQLSSGGFLLKMQIVNQNGQPIKRLEDFTLSGPSGCFYWDGISDSGFMSPMGIYFVFIEYYHPNGTRGRERLDFVLTGL